MQTKQWTVDDNYTIWTCGRSPKRIGSFYTLQHARQWFDRQHDYSTVRVWVRNQYGEDRDLGCFEKLAKES